MTREFHRQCQKKSKAISRSVLVSITSLILAAIFSIHCAGPKGRRSQISRPSVILIGLDALRADHMSIYGYPKKTTPQIDSFSRESILFEGAISQAPWTTPSFMSILTSLYPSVHGLLKYPNPGRLDDSILTWPVIMKTGGYVTGSFNGGGYLSGEFGFEKGFDHFYSKRSYHNNATRLFVDALDWISQHLDQNFFLFLHTYSVHRPYWPPKSFRPRFFSDRDGAIDHIFSLPPKEWDFWQEKIKTDRITQEDIRRITALYDAEINYVDDAFGQFIQGLKEIEVYDQTIIILTSDHGDELFDHGQIDHIRTVYQELIHVPLIIKIPDVSPKHIRGWMENINLMPTVLEIVGLDSPWNQGKSMTEVIWDGREIKSPAFSEGGPSGAKKALISGEWKYIYNLKTQTEELYHLVNDPAEIQNLFKERHNISQSMRASLQKIISENASLAKNHTWHFLDMDKRLKKRLRSLGYLQHDDGESD